MPVLPTRNACSRILSILFLVAACPVYPAFSRPATDVLVMNNGDRLTCEVKTLEAGVLQVKLDYVNDTISIDWRRVARMESQALFLLELQDGTFYSGKVISPETLAGTPVKLEIQAAGQE